MKGTNSGEQLHRVRPPHGTTSHSREPKTSVAAEIAIGKCTAAYTGQLNIPNPIKKRLQSTVRGGLTKSAEIGAQCAQRDRSNRYHGEKRYRSLGPDRQVVCSDRSLQQEPLRRDKRPKQRENRHHFPEWLRDKCNYHSCSFRRGIRSTAHPASDGSTRSNYDCAPSRLLRPLMLPRAHCSAAGTSAP